LSILAQYCVFRAVRQAGIKVILSGQGADELLGGYSPFAAARLASLVRSGRWLAAARFYHRGSRAWPGRRRLMIGLAQHLLPPVIQRPLRRALGQDAVPAWMNGAWFRDRDVALRSVRDQRIGSGEPLKAALRDSLTRTNLPELLRYEDRNSMAHSVESRVPFLAAPLAEFVLSLPEGYIINERCITKACLRDAMRSVVPDAILERRDKVAFSAPLRQWLRSLQPWLDARLRGETTSRIGVFHPEQLIRCWDAVRAGLAQPPAALWRWANLIGWAEQFEVVADG
jgi:asparagine synthase (glutamine-hydrolysing)